jgi:transcriptional regulator with XRE-family HTH domain
MQLRRSRGLTQTQLAEQINSSQRAISHYETVAEFPPPPVIIDLAKVLAVSTDELLGLKTPKPRAAAIPALDSDAKRLWKRFQQVMTLPEKDRRAVIRLVNSLVAAQHRPGNGAAARR